VSTANEQPGPGLPEEPVEADGAAAAAPGTSPASAEQTQDPAAAELAPGADAGAGSGVAPVAGAEPAAEAGTETGTGTGTDTETGSESEESAETEDERIAREKVEFEKLVAAFHGESAPDPQGGLPEPAAGTAGPHKIIRYPVLEPRPEWEGSIVEPTDEITSDPLDYIEHYEPPDPELPQASAATLASWTMLIGGVTFLVLHALLGWQTPEYLGWLAIIGVFGGIITLVMRMKPDRDEYDDPDNGAVV
jgi:hypothetical protein